MENEKITRRTTPGVSSDNQHYIVLSLLHEWLSTVALPCVKGVLFDFGCGGRPYEKLFQSKITKYIAADIADTSSFLIDIPLRPGQPVPLPSETADTILSTQTLEHVYDLDLYMSECYRLLRKDGVLILSVPMQWRQHEKPYDYWRFTSYGLRELLNRHGFDVEKADSCGGAWALTGQIINSHLDVHARGNKLIYRLVNSIALWLDKKYPDQDETLLWMCIARKK